MLNVDQQLENIFKNTCRTWQNCNKSSVISFLSECREHSIDPQYVFNWLGQHKEQIAHWDEFSESAQEWVNEHTASGNPFTP